MSENAKFDDQLFEMLKECKTLPFFLDQIFGFLQRRTDFYVVAPDEKSHIGLPPGLAEQLVRRSFYKWSPTEPPLMSEAEIPVCNEEVIIGDEEELVENVQELSLEPKRTEQIQTERFNASESFNGAVYENYSWSQTINEVDIIVRVPENTTTKNLTVSILTNRITVKVADVELLSGELCQKCKHSDAIWSLDKRKLQIHLEKTLEMWWECLIKSEPKLDVSKIDCTRPFEDLPEEAQAKIEQLEWNQERKRLGLPTMDEINIRKTLKQAWNAEGSPFSGPFDPSAVNLT